MNVHRRLWRATGLLFLIGLSACLGCSKSTEPDSDPGPDTTFAQKVYTYTIVNEYPHQTDAFTQGLQYVDSVLYEGTGGFSGSSLRKVEVITGAVLEIRPLNGYFGEGIHVLGDRIYQLTWLDNVGFIYDRETFDSISNFTYPTEGWGLTFNGAHFIMSDGTDTLYFRDTLSFAEVGRVAVKDTAGPVLRLNELEYIDDEVWANVWQTRVIARIDPATGRVNGYVALDSLVVSEYEPGWGVLNGIAWDSTNNRIFVTGKNWSKLFEIEVMEAQ